MKEHTLTTVKDGEATVWPCFDSSMAASIINAVTPDSWSIVDRNHDDFSKELKLWMEGKY